MLNFFSISLASQKKSLLLRFSPKKTALRKFWGLLSICFLSAHAVFAQPANDNCSSAVALTPSTSNSCAAATAGTLEAATQSILGTCSNASLPVMDVWYQFTATSTSHRITVHPDGANLNPSINVFSGACGSLTSISCTNSSASGSDEVAQIVNLSVGGTYYVRVFDATGTIPTTPTFTICITKPALAISGGTNHGSICALTSASPKTYKISNTGSVTASGITVTSSSSEFIVSALSGTSVAPGANLTFKVTFSPTTTGIKSADITVSSTTSGVTPQVITLTGSAGPITTVVQTLPASSLDYTSAVLNGSLITLGVCPNTTQKGFVYSVTSDNASPTVGGSGVTKVVITGVVESTYFYSLTGLTEGTDYSYRAYDFDGTTYIYGGVQTFLTKGILNDNCTGAVAVTPSASSTCVSPTAGSVFGSSTSILETCGETGITTIADVWYKFVATSTTHLITVDPTGLNFDVVINLRQGACNGSSIQCEDAGGNGVSETMTATGLTVGATYYVRIYPWDGEIPAVPDFTICITTPCLSNIFSGEGDWTDGTHWSCGVPPTAVSNQNVSLAPDAVATLNTNYEVGTTGTFFMDARSRLVITAGNTMKVSGSADFNGRRVRIRSVAGGNGSLGQSTGTITGATNFIVERFIPKNESRAWRLLSVPTKGTQSIHDAWQEGAVSATDDPNPGFGTIITSKLADFATKGFDYKTTDYSLKTYNTAANKFDPTVSTLGAIQTTAGYYMYIRGDRTVTPSVSTATINKTILRTTGSIYTGTQPVITVPANKDAVVGNIYASAVDMRTLSAAHPVITLWDPKVSGSNGLGAYQTFTFNGADYQVTPGGGSYGINGSKNNIIQSGQAFFVSAAASPVSLQFTEASKTDQGTGFNVFDVVESPANSLFANLYVVKDNDSLVLADGTMQLFNENFNENIDEFDARKLLNIDESFYITKNHQNLIVEKKKLLTATDTIQFGISNLISKSYQLDILAHALDNNNLSAWLQDSYTKQNTLINLSGKTSVKFSIDAGDKASSAADRFRIVFKPNAVLAIAHPDLKAYLSNKNEVSLEWNMADQKDIKSYIIEKSPNGTVFSQAASVIASGNTSTPAAYQWIDKTPVAGSNFYRVASVHVNGTKDYSRIAKVAIENIGGFSVYPNPVTNGSVTLRFAGMLKGSYLVRILNASGSVVYTKKITYNGGTEVNTLAPGTRISAMGTYFLELIKPDKQRITQALIISK